MKLLKKNIEKSIEHANENKFFSKLNKIYNGIDRGECQGCTSCCMESVDTFYIEFLNIYKYLKGNYDYYKQLMPRVVKYYFFELVTKNKCPFLDRDGKCRIYEVRPLTCRLFGHLNKEEYEENYKSVLKENRRSNSYFKKNYEINIPKEIVNYKIEYCNEFKVSRKVKRYDRQSMIDNIFIIESSFFMNELISEEFLRTGLVSWFTYIYFDMEEAGSHRLKIMREYLKGAKSPSLENIMDRLVFEG
ncbi:MAG: YkgJ family cysteine cluster protein [Clostridia bacterium]|nr:YkgJ family cysteine cluster protein [Clostridia bacterium]